MNNPVAKIGRYLIGGLVIGGFWYLNKSRPAWEEALRTIVVFTVVMILVKARLKSKPVTIHLVPLIASKATLVLIAAGVEEALRTSHAVGDPALVVAIGLGLAVMLVGGLFHRFFFTVNAPRRSYEDQAR
ncbi:hypothetical protein [Amycolatopsis saalfeldensis]|uniref:Uncharacterized protein n=1 Tax=Amycolatopsis saalfeldensis TaxID=394193 RepID=A0A1H8YI60_9PSEU|nr:hypothetical protein [Amycolatopsis saalfeldensis]SEP51128.1 hypothetical protein SAMN04489732_115155 [Amycolatopsis saalfeldensis]